MIAQEKIDAAIELIRRSRVNRIYFFENLADPEWIAPLAEKGFFAEPPAAIETGGGVRFPAWAEGEYLLRMAEMEPAAVGEIVHDLSVSENVRVRSVLIQIALLIPDEMVRRAELETEWLKDREWVWLDYSEHAGQLATKLAETGQCTAATDLLRELLAVRSNGETDTFRRRPLIRIDDWYFERLCEEVVPGILAACGMPVLELLATTLESYISIDVGMDPPEDYSTTWRPNLLFGRQYERPRDFLIDSLRDGVVSWVGDDPERLREAVELLARQNRNFFVRLTIYLLSGKPTVDPDISMRFAADAELSRASSFDRELDLLRAAVVEANDGQIPEQILDCVERGPGWPPEDPAELERLEVTGDQRAEIVDRWVLARLKPYATAMTEGWADKYRELVEKYGEPTEWDDDVVRTGFVSESPLEASELKAMTPDELFGFAQSWQPDETHFGPSMDGLARAVAQRVALDLPDFAGEVDRLASLPYVFATSILMRIESAIREDADYAVDWEFVFALTDATLRRMVEAGDESESSLVSVPTAATVERALTVDRFPNELTERAWDSIERAVSDAIAVQPEINEPEFGRSIAIVSPLGRSTHAVLAFVAARKKQDSIGIQDLPGVVGMLDRLLDSGDRRMLAAREAIGSRLGTLFWAGKPWFEEHVAMLFPDDAPDFRDSLWRSFLAWSQPYLDMYEVLAEQYERSIADISPDDPEEGDGSRSFAVSLAEHMGTLYWHGIIDLSNGGIMRQFVANAPRRAVEHLLDFLGRSIDDAELEPGLAQRLMDLWDFVSEAMEERRDDLAAELSSSFGWWWGSGQLEAGWADAWYLKLLELNVKLDPEFRVFDRLKARADTEIDSAVELLAAYVRANPDSWRLHSGRGAIRSILETGLESGDNAVIFSTKALIDQLVALGHLEYRELVA